MIKGVIFDIDGTLIDSVDLHAKSWQETFKLFGRQIPYEDVRYQIGKGGDQLMPVFFSQDELDKIGKEMEQFRGQLFKRHYLPHVRAFRKGRELFQRILADGKKIALASSAKGDELAAYKKIAHIEDLIDAETSRDDAKRSKPYPDIFSAALARLYPLKPSEVIVVGDTHYDAIAAGKVEQHGEHGIATIGVLSGGFPREELLAAGCIEIYQNVADLLEHYDRSIIAARSLSHSAR